MSLAHRTTEPTDSPDVRPVYRRFSALPMQLALLAIAAVWVAGCVWSFQEQTAFAAHAGFTEPRLLPLILDGLAIAMAGVAYAASLDGRAAVLPRLGTALAVVASAASNGTWAWQRSDADPATVALGAGVPIVANIAFEVLLSEVRRQVMRRRGLPAPVPVPTPRLLRLAMAPVATLKEWRVLVLELTALSPTGHEAMPAPAPSPTLLEEHRDEEPALTDAGGALPAQHITERDADQARAPQPSPSLAHEDLVPREENLVKDEDQVLDEQPVDQRSDTGVPLARSERPGPVLVEAYSSGAPTATRATSGANETPRPTTKEAVARAFYLEQRAQGIEPSNRDIAEAADASEGRVRAWKPVWRRELEDAATA